MLDSYIIEKIKRERQERSDGARAPLRIEVPHPSPRPPGHEGGEADPEERDRGVVIIDFALDFRR